MRLTAKLTAASPSRASRRDHGDEIHRWTDLLSKPILALPRESNGSRGASPFTYGAASALGADKRQFEDIHGAVRSIYIRERSRLGSRGSSNFREQSAIRPSCPSVSRCRAESMHGLSYPKSRSRFLIAPRDPERSRDRRDHRGIAAWTSRDESRAAPRLAVIFHGKLCVRGRTERGERAGSRSQARFDSPRESRERSPKRANASACVSLLVARLDVQG